MAHASTEAKYTSLRRELAEMVRSTLRPHDPLPSERELMARYGVSRMTVRTAVSGLVEEGLVYRIRGSGTYVAEGAMISKSLRLTSFTEDMLERGLQPATELISAEEVPANVSVARDLAISPGDPVLNVCRLRLADGSPMALEKASLPVALVPGLLDEDLSGSLYAIMRERYGLHLERAQQQIKATVVTPEEARLLRVPAHSPALHVHRIGVDQWGTPLERTDSVYRADRYSFTVNVRREHRP